jgi:hypothetical protein
MADETKTPGSMGDAYNCSVSKDAIFCRVVRQKCVRKHSITLPCVRSDHQGILAGCPPQAAQVARISTP